VSDFRKPHKPLQDADMMNKEPALFVGLWHHVAIVMTPETAQVPPSLGR
jgi:hypothetical protein